MGMFDYIRCELPLPDGWQPDELQSKDFNCEMVTHIISKDGRMMLDRGEWDTVPLLERRMWKAEWGDSEEAQKEHALEAACGSITRKPKYVDANFHGIVNFYANETIGYEAPQLGDRFRRPIHKWHEYNAKFTDGQLISIEIAPD